MRGLVRFLDGSVSITAPAKLNLFLHITGRRQDGYHLLESLFAFTKGGDQITVSAAKKEGAGLRINGPFAQALQGTDPKDNIVWRAATMLSKVAGRSLDTKITLQKNLPVASGIGGGSADAAATLLALNAFWGLDMPPAALADIALTLGADVPACLNSSPLYVTGIGERITRTELPKAYGVLLVNEGTGLSTPAVFNVYKKRLPQRFDRPLGQGVPRGHSAFLKFIAAVTGNSLQTAAEELCPTLQNVLTVLAEDQSALITRMSGSGATCFALYENLTEAQIAAGRLRAVRPSWWCKADTLYSC